MNKDGEDNSLRGEMTDVNVWNRILKDEEVDAFNQCESLEGNVVSWREAAPANPGGISTSADTSAPQTEDVRKKVRTAGADRFLVSQLSAAAPAARRAERAQR